MSDPHASRWPWPSSQLLVSLALAAVVAVVGRYWTSSDLVRTRHILVRNPVASDAGGRVIRPLRHSSVRLDVIVARIGGGTQDGEVTIRASASHVATVPVIAARSVRLDVQVSGGLPLDGTLEFSGPPGWRLEYLEVANVHGFTAGLFNATFVPSNRSDWPRPSMWWLLVVGSLLVPVGAAYPPLSLQRGGKARRLLQSLAWLGTTLLVAVTVAPLTSRYAIVLAPSSYLLCLVCVYLSPAIMGYRWVRQAVASRTVCTPRTVDGVTVVCAIAVFYAASASFGLAEQHHGDYSRFVRMSDAFSRSPLLSHYPDVRDRLSTDPYGYDGQFMFLMALDPLLTRLEPAGYSQVADSPPYRYGRIGFSWLVRLASLGDPALFPVSMVRLVLLGHVLSAVFLVLLARQSDVSPWPVLGYVLIPGFLVSLACGLPESIAGALLLGGLWAYRADRRTLAIVFWALSLLVRETGLLLVFAVVLHASLTTTTKRRAFWLLLCTVPMLSWRAYVGWRLAPAFGAEAWWHNPGDLTVPLMGFARLWRVNDVAHGLGQPYNVLFPVLLVALLALAVALWRVKPGPASTAALLYALLAVSLDYDKIWAWMGNGERGTYEAFLMVLVSALCVRGLPRRLQTALAVFSAALFIYCFGYATHFVWFRPALLIFH